jgi:hypothetical protein
MNDLELARNFDDDRMDSIGQNGNDGLHYQSARQHPAAVFVAIADDDAEACGTKHDDGKARFDLIPPNAERTLAEVLTMGAEKYGPDNWKKVDDLERRYIAAARRHVNAYARGEVLDSESGLHHLAHAAASLLFIVEKETKD